jgi:site-specific DNA recombinase
VIGYLNTREMVDGREVRTVAIDPDRGQYVTAAFQLYATGDYSLSELAAILESRGFRNRPRPNAPSLSVDSNRLQRILRNDYYIGVVRYAGITSLDGRHPKLTDEATFQIVQGILDSQRRSGERSWRHHSYLRGTVYCGECDKRLIYTRAKGRHGGIYEYFVCNSSKERACTQSYHRVEAVEQAIEREYGRIQLSDDRREQIRSHVQN